MKTKHIVIIVIIILLGYLLISNKNNEHFGLSNEAVQSISSVYSNTTGTSVFNNIRAAGNITGNVTGNVTGNLTGDVSGNIYINNFLLKSDSTTNALNVYKKDTMTPLLSVHDNGNIEVNNNIIVKSVCFKNTDGSGTCLTGSSDTIGIKAYKTDSTNKQRGIIVASDGNGNGAILNPVGSDRRYFSYDNPYANDNNWTLLNTPLWQRI